MGNRTQGGEQPEETPPQQSQSTSRAERALVVRAEEVSEFVTSLVLAGRAANESRHKGNVYAEYHATCRPNTLRRHYYDLRCLCQFLSEEEQVQRTPQDMALSAEAWRGMTYGLVSDFRRWMLQQGFSVGTINNRVATVHQYCRLAGPPPRGAGVIPEQELTAILTIAGYNGKIARNVDQHRARNGIPTRVGAKKASFTRLSRTDVSALQRTTTPPPTPDRIPRDRDQVLQARDAVMWALFAEHLVRVGDLVALTIEDLDMEEKVITIYREKGNETWLYEMGPLTEAALRVYLRQLRELGHESGPLFVGYRGSPMTTSAINKRVGLLGKQLGFGDRARDGSREKIKGKLKQRLSPHDLRHYGAIALLDAGRPLNEVQAMGGWRTAHMPLHYAQFSKDAVIPFHGGKRKGKKGGGEQDAPGPPDREPADRGSTS